MSARARRHGARWWVTEIRRPIGGAYALKMMARWIPRHVPVDPVGFLALPHSDAQHWNMLRRVLLEIETGEVTVVCTEDMSPAETYAGNVEYEASNGWTLVVFNDCGDWDYLDHVIAPDGWRGEFEALPDDLKFYRCTEQEGRDLWGIPGYLADSLEWTGWQPRPGWQARRAMHIAEVERYDREWRARHPLGGEQGTIAVTLNGTPGQLVHGVVISLDEHADWDGPGPCPYTARHNREVRIGRFGTIAFGWLLNPFASMGHALFARRAEYAAWLRGRRAGDAGPFCAGPGGRGR